MEEHQNKLDKFWHELKRRKVVGVIVTYITVAIAIMYFSQFLENAFNLPNWFDKVITLILLVGFPIAIIFSWIFDVSSKGISVTEPEVPKDRIESNKQIPEKSIIVLPFDNISSDPEQEYFSDGLTEEIITDLSYIKDLLVISRSSAMTFKGSKQTIKKIASKVNVRYVLEGSVRKSGNDLRIVAQLIDAQTDTHVWAEKYTGKLDDIFDIQEKVSRSVADSLKLKLSNEEKEKIAEQPINDPLAYELYLKARKEILTFSKEGLDNALIYIQKGMDIVGENVLLLTGMGYIYYQYVNIGIKTDDDALKKIEEYAKKIFTLEPDSPYGHLILGLTVIFWKSSKEGLKHLKKVISKYPNNFDALFWMCGVSATIGKTDTALSLAQKLMDIDPLNDMVNFFQGYVYYWNGKFEKALSLIDNTLNLFPDSMMAAFFQSLLLASTGKLEESCSNFETLSTVTPDVFSILSLKYKVALSGNIREFYENDSPEFKIWAWRDFQCSYWMTQVYAIADLKKEALNWLEHSVDLGMINYPFISQLDPLLENIRKEPRFKTLILTVKKEWEEFVV